METILHLLPLTRAQKAAFQAAAPESEHLFLPTNDRGGASSIPQEWRERTTILLGYVPPDQLKTFPNLKWVQSWNAGVDPYLAPGVLPGGVRLTSAVGAYGPAVSEHMLAMLLAIYKRLPAYRDQQRAHIWADLGPVGSLAGKTVLVGGAGDIGRHFARLVRALGAQRVIGLRRSAGCPVEGFDEIYGLGALDGLLPQADVVALALP
ncbi:MAG: NAD(P)-dependent oxidoreductase, partial [Flavonifractor sp.]|nr:NAD(P)-dependent oxidoreductase [Flavonifractor sp.]